MKCTRIKNVYKNILLFISEKILSCKMALTTPYSFFLLKYTTNLLQDEWRRTTNKTVKSRQWGFSQYASSGVKGPTRPCIHNGKTSAFAKWSFQSKNGWFRINKPPLTAATIMSHSRYQMWEGKKKWREPHQVAVMMIDLLDWAIWRQTPLRLCSLKMVRMPFLQGAMIVMEKHLFWITQWLHGWYVGKNYCYIWWGERGFIK